MKNNEQVADLTDYVNVIMRSLLVSAKSGAPAEGRIPFNPLYFNILRVVGGQGPIRPSEIAAFFKVSRTTISTAVRALEKRDLVSLHPDPTDGRATQLQLTPTGRDTLEAVLRQDTRNCATMLEMLDKRDRDRFVKMMGTIAAGLESA